MVYRILADEIIIIAVAPDAREPGYCRSRKTDVQAVERPDPRGTSLMLKR